MSIARREFMTLIAGALDATSVEADAASHALCISNRDFYSRQGCRTCIKANFVYYRWDGSTSFCGERHTVDCADPVSSIGKAVDLMKQGVVPPECRLCQYLPPHLFRKTLEENKAELV